MAALMAAMACVATMVIKIPIPATGGYINLGDCIVLLSGIILGPVYGGIAAGLGSALADLLGGYVAFAPATFIIKGLMAVVAALLIRDISRKNILNVLFVGFIAEVIMVVGYFVFGIIRIMLKKQIKFSFVKRKSIRIIYPSYTRCKMINISIRNIDF